MDSQNKLIKQGDDSMNAKVQNDHNIKIKEEVNAPFSTGEIKEYSEEINTQEVDNSLMNINSNLEPDVIIKEEVDIPFVSVGIEEYDNINKVEDTDTIFIKEEEKIKDYEENFLLQEKTENVSRIALKCF